MISNFSKIEVPLSLEQGTKDTTALQNNKQVSELNKCDDDISNFIYFKG